jgi:Plant transposon protein
MLDNPRTQDPSDAKGGKLFRLRFRVPFPFFERLVQITRVNAWFSERKDAAGRSAAPLELKILGVLRVLERGYCFDGIEELCFISREVIRTFFHAWCERFSKKNLSIDCNPPTTQEEVQRTLAVYNRLSFPGCIGSTDCVHARWERCPVGERFLHKGKEGFPTLSYEVTVDRCDQRLSLCYQRPHNRQV